MREMGARQGAQQERAWLGALPPHGTKLLRACAATYIILLPHDKRCLPLGHHSQQPNPQLLVSRSDWRPLTLSHSSRRMSLAALTKLMPLGGLP